MIKRQLLASLAASGLCWRADESHCDERHRIKMPYASYHKFVEKEWQAEFRHKLEDLCTHL